MFSEEAVQLIERAFLDDGDGSILTAKELGNLGVKAEEVGYCFKAALQIRPGRSCSNVSFIKLEAWNAASEEVKGWMKNFCRMEVKFNMLKILLAGDV